MIFSKEDSAAWHNSEIIQEFEKIALETDVLNGPPAESYQPLGFDEEEEKDWEEEGDEEKLLSAIEEMGVSKNEEESLEEELSKVYTANLIENLQKLAHNLASNSKMSAAYTIERAIVKIKTFTGR